MDAGAGQGWIERRWKAGVFAVWLAVAVAMIAAKWPDIQALALGDTDDNLRLVQVRDLIAGQGWSDLVQHRLAPPWGADIHWSRLPDLPIAGLILLLAPLLGEVAAEQWAATLAPLLPLGLGLAALALTVRRLVDPSAWWLALLVALCAGMLMPMWTPLRIDHHGWQLTLLAIAVAGLADPKRRRGGATSGIAAALSLAIGLEMLPYLALIAAAIALFWVRDRAEAPRIAAFGATFGGGAGLLFLLFASTANRAPVCDALSPVWLSAAAAGGGMLVLLALLRPADRRMRLALAGAAGAALAAGFALLWPDCLARPEGASAELRALWLDQVGEARPIQSKGWRTAMAMIALPLAGLAGYALALFRHRSPALIATAALAIFAFALLFWQVRAAPAAQLLAVPGAALLGWILLRRWRASHSMAVRIGGTLAALALATGLYAALPIAMFKAQGRDGHRPFARACATNEALAPVAALPRGTFLAPIDFSPRLLAMAPHSAIAGPYHRNGEDILAVLRAFRDAPDEARATIARYDVDYVLLCPGISEERLYREGGESSLFAALISGNPPDWLEPVNLPEDSPLRVWRIR